MFSVIRWGECIKKSCTWQLIFVNYSSNELHEICIYLTYFFSLSTIFEILTALISITGLVFPVCVLASLYMKHEKRIENPIITIQKPSW